MNSKRSSNMFVNSNSTLDLESVIGLFHSQISEKSTRENRLCLFLRKMTDRGAELVENVFGVWK